MQGRKKPATLDEVILKRTKFQQHGAWWQSQHFGTICCRFCLPKIEFWENRIRSFDRHSFLENLVSFFCLFVIQIKVWINKMFWHLFFSSTEISSYLLSSVITLFFNLIPQLFWFSSVRSRWYNTTSSISVILCKSYTPYLLIWQISLFKSLMNSNAANEFAWDLIQAALAFLCQGVQDLHGLIDGFTDCGFNHVRCLHDLGILHGNLSNPCVISVLPAQWSFKLNSKGKW